MESQLIGRLFLALKRIVTQTLSGPGEGMGKGLSNLIQVGPAFGREGGFRQRTSSGPSQPALCCGCGGHACWREEGRRTPKLEVVVLQELQKHWTAKIPGIVSLKGHT